MTRPSRTLGPTLTVALAACLVLGVGSAAQAEWAVDPPRLTDAAIADRVMDELKLDPSVDTYRVEVRAHAGVVTLSGEVAHLLARDRAAEIAGTVRGVRGTVNQLKVPDRFRADMELKGDVMEALQRDPATARLTIGVEMNRGTAVLTGDVDTYPEKRLAGRVAEGVRGLLGLDNRLHVRVHTERSGEQVRQDVLAALRWDALIDGALIGVRVEDRVVSLYGTVGSAAERRRAELEAFVRGARRVDAEELHVVGWTRDPMMRQDKYGGFSEAQVAAAVRRAFFYDPRIEASRLRVEVARGVATLRGTVADLKACRSAARTAHDVVGVHRVVNRIRVRPAPVRDPVLEERVRLALVRDPYVSSFVIQVTSRRGVLTLQGHVDSVFERAQADDIASRVDGTLGVINDLQVDHPWPVVAYAPYVDYDWDLFDRDWYSPPAVVTTEELDPTIAHDIRAGLWWSPFVRARDVSVRVQDGVATLKGTVGTDAERRTAREVARRGGAIAIKDRLQVLADTCVQPKSTK